MHESLTIGQLSTRSGVAPSALRYYERLGLIRAERTGGNQRRYARTELRRVAFVRISQQVGISLEEIREALDSLPASRMPSAEDWARLSATWRERLNEKIRLMTKLRDDLDGCIGCGCLSLQRCTLYNPGDSLAGEGPGARLVLPREAAEPTPTP
ncbi:redox-sensitive transcriptional activator SoxR [Micromonospora peucetia]|uniref:Redox-sensitive transcriptional activator SoxR n=1 Tax=Micromonospora peucetia TaxID=47871 RepID=A0A1C6UZ72_9ACTN|nr:redox-sensitive transcriptional activator SoxR [Micromonospora peucetia]MCX4387774.1 redox-sensitive transcriptional activator SoxR [Micromonospora peucetia]WSA35085.1 redox-sensitive transcriptional activator SoxR [Micromonospora peucetia]SCL59312.1 MerR family transcriptional regulator, redox-sensitive transcriptional activator SoxR [Micromonospora peucetia]